MKFSSYFFFLALTTVFIFSCQQDVPADLAKVQEQEAKYEKSPNKENAAGYVAAVTLYSAKNPKKQKTEELLEKASIYAEAQGQTVVQAGITNELIKQFPGSSKTDERLLSLIQTMDKIGKKDASKTLKYFYAKSNPNAEKSSSFQSEIEGLPEDPTVYLKKKAESIFENADAGGLNRRASIEYVDASEAFVLVNPNDKESPNLLFNAAEIAKTVGTYNKALSLYDWIINNYPTDKQAPTSQFLKAFILEDNLKNIDAARENYELFIENYPDHHFADDAKFSLDNLGKTNEEIQKELEALQAKNAGK